MPNGCRHYAFTCNNYTENDIASIAKSSDKSRVDYIIYGKEVSKSGTPHLQGHVSFNKQTSIKRALKVLGIQAHFSFARNTSNSIEYCKKDGDYVEYGTPPTVTNTRGKRSDLAAFKEAVKSGNRDKVQLREQHSEVYARHPRFCDAYILDNTPKVEVECHPLREWQQNLNDLLKHSPDRRTVHFVVDYKGNSGKTWFAQYYCSVHDKAVILEPSKKEHMAYALPDELRVLFVDCTREQCEFVNYSFLESCKNGMVFNTKYESRIKRYNPMHVVVMMNNDPDDTKLSEDRYNIIRL